MLPADLFLKHIIFPVVIVLIVLGNGALIHVLTLVRKRQTHQSLMNYFVIALAASDFLVGFPTMPLLLLAEKQLTSAGYACMAVMCLTVSQTSASCLLLIAVGVERYVAILKPLHYQSLVTRRRAYTGIGACWTAGVVLGMLPLLGWNTLGTYAVAEPTDATNLSSMATAATQDATSVGLDLGRELHPCRFPLVFPGSYVGFVFLGLHFPLWLILGSLYGRIMTQCRQQRKLICSLRSEGNSSLEQQPRHHQHQQQPHSCSACSSRRNYKIFRVLTLLVCYFILSWLPLALYYAVIYRGFRKESLDLADIKESDLTSWLYPVAVSMAYTNSAINPFLYGFGNRSVRRAWAKTRIVTFVLRLWYGLRGGSRGESVQRGPDGRTVASPSVSSHLIQQRCRLT